METNFKSIIDLLNAFPTEQHCIDYLEKRRWNGNVISPFDATSKVYKCKNNRYKCVNTNKYFNARTNTIFEDSKIPLQKWFMAHYIFSSHKKGISSHQLGRDISVTQKSAWFMVHRLRYAYDHPNFKKNLSNIVEADETYIGGDEKNKHGNKRKGGTEGRSCKTKTPVFGMLERGGHVIAKVVENTKKRTLQPLIIEYVAPEAHVMTDEWTAYFMLDKHRKHSKVSHSAKQYVDGLVHTNGVENFWSHLKRGIDGIYHWVSTDHLQAYVDEFAIRYNTRTFDTQERFDMLLSNTSEKRLTYNKLIQKA